MAIKKSAKSGFRQQGVRLMKRTDPGHNTRLVALTRREMLIQCASGFGMLGLMGLLAEHAQASTAAAANPLSVRPPMFAPRAKRVIFLFMSGGPSHVDTFDPKPRLRSDDGKPLPFEKPKLERTKTGNLLGSSFEFKKRGQSGIEVSNLFPNVGACVDDLC